MCLKKESTLKTPHKEDHCTPKFIKTIHSCFLHQHINTPTQATPYQNPTLVDLVLTLNNPETHYLLFTHL